MTASIKVDTIKDYNVGGLFGGIGGIELGFKKAGFPISWANEIDAAAMEQVGHLAALPFAYDHIAIMPDCHSGYGMPIFLIL